MQVGYRNLYHETRTFVLRSSNPGLVRFGAQKILIPALQQRSLSLQISAAQTSPGIKDVLVFINDDADRNEDCYRVRVHVYDPAS